MQNKPLVSVICLCYNHKDYVEIALNSVVNQTYSNIEIVIADDCSFDGSQEVIKKWQTKNPATTFIINSKNLGNTKTFNKALKLAKGEYIIDFATDDVLLPNCIEKQIETFKKTKLQNLGVVYANIDLVDENGKIRSTYYTENENPESGDIYKMVIGRTTMICSIASMIKRNVFETIGFYDENLAYEDLDFWVRASREFEFEYIPEILAQKRELSTSLSAQFLHQKSQRTKRLHQSTLKIFQKILRLNKTKEEHKATLGRIRFEMHKFIKSREWKLLFQLLVLEIKFRVKCW